MRIKQDQAEIYWDEPIREQCGKTRIRTHVYRVRWPAAGTAAVLVANYAGTRRR
jgi:hypothetical protein